MSKTLAGPVRLSSAIERVTSSAIRDLLKITERAEVISLAGGLPAPEAFPATVIAEALAAAVLDDPASCLQYSTTEGWRPLRQWVAERHGAALDQVIVTSGAQQAIELVFRATVDPGTTVAMADPGYVGAIQAARLAGARLLAVPSDAEGLQVDALAALLAAGERPEVVYVVADFDNPTGATLSTERRRALAELADRYGFLVMEDNPYGQLRWGGVAPPSLASMTDRVVALGTVSKILAPGLRVGWAVAPPDLAQALGLAKQALDLHTSTVTQQACHRVLTEPGFLAAHLAGLPSLYRERADALATALDTELGDRIVFDRPEGGMFVWARLPGVDTQALLGRAVDAGVAFVPGAAFGIASDHPDSLRLSFATAAPVELAEGVRRLRTALPS